MADEQYCQLASADLEDGELVDDCEPTPKKTKVDWQETLVSLLATQQKQITQLSNQLNMVAGPTPSSCPSTSDSSTAQVLVPPTTSFRLAEFDPDNTGYAIAEWLDVATKLKEELHVGDVLMIAKTGEALKGRAHQYYCNWRPVRRTWSEFNKDLIIAFPDKDTPGARAYIAATLCSLECKSLTDYGIKKLRYIQRFYGELPWNIISSMVEYGLNHHEAQAAIRIQKPLDDRELLKLLSEFDARRRQNQPPHNFDTSNESVKITNFTKRVENRKHGAALSSKRFCFKCGRQGHLQDACRSSRKDESPKETNKTVGPTNIPSCIHCKKMGHTEPNCWYKHGKPKKAFIFKK